jgi:Nuclease-related domain
LPIARGVASTDGKEAGQIDPVTGAIVATVEAFDGEFASVGRQIRPGFSNGDAGSPADHDFLDTNRFAKLPSVSDGCPSRPEVDLSANVAGASARAKRDEVNGRAPLLNLFARMLGIKTEERAWRVGAKGEEKVGKQLARLSDDWRVLHAAQVSEVGTDIDHVVIGPAGVFTLNTKRHPDGKVTVYERALYVNGSKVDYLQKSRVEARRASRLLTAACGFAVDARSAIVFVDLADIKEKGRPDEVIVTTRRRLTDLLQSLPPCLSPEQVMFIHHHACNNRTWLPGA